MFLLNSCLGLFSAAETHSTSSENFEQSLLFGFKLCFSAPLDPSFSLPAFCRLAHYCAPRHPLSLTYGVNLPSSLTTLLPLVLGFSPHLPVSVCGTSTFTLDSGFSRQCGICHFGTFFPSPSGLRIIRSFFPGLSISLGRTFPAVRLTYPPASPLLFYRVTVVQEFQPVVHRLRFSASP